VPSLRERRADIPALVEVLAEDMALRSGSAPPELSAAAIALLSAQNWRGNIRELRNVMEQAAMRSDSQRIEVPHLEAVLRESGVKHIAPPVAMAHPQPAPEPGVAVRPLAEQVVELERRAIEAALASTGGNKFAAAKLLGISRAKLYERLDGLSETKTLPDTKTLQLS
jgi:DNA-binding NtrC family response regulator